VRQLPNALGITFDAPPCDLSAQPDNQWTTGKEKGAKLSPIRNGVRLRCGNGFDSTKPYNYGSLVFPGIYNLLIYNDI